MSYIDDWYLLRVKFTNNSKFSVGEVWRGKTVQNVAWKLHTCCEGRRYKTHRNCKPLACRQLDFVTSHTRYFMRKYFSWMKFGQAITSGRYISTAGLTLNCYHDLRLAHNSDSYYDHHSQSILIPIWYKNVLFTETVYMKCRRPHHRMLVSVQVHRPSTSAPSFSQMLQRVQDLQSLLD